MAARRENPMRAQSDNKRPEAAGVQPSVTGSGTTRMRRKDISGQILRQEFSRATPPLFLGSAENAGIPREFAKTKKNPARRVPVQSAQLRFPSGNLFLQKVVLHQWGPFQISTGVSGDETRRQTVQPAALPWYHRLHCPCSIPPRTPFLDRRFP